MTSPRPAVRRAPRILLALLVGYLVCAAGVSAYVRHRLWDMRTLYANIVDYTWQLELPWQASQGNWSGRDFFFPMGPLWQLLAYLGSLPAPFDDSRAVAGMQTLVLALGMAISAWLIAGRTRRDWPRLGAFVALVTLSYGAGVATVRPLLSTAHLFAYRPSAAPDAEPRWRDAVLASGLATAGLLLSFDRLVLATGAAGLMAAGDLLLRRRLAAPLRPALVRLGRYLAAQLGWLVAMSGIGALLGFHPVAYLVAQPRLASAYAVTLAKTADATAHSAAALLVCAAGVALWSALSRRTRTLEAVWIAGALPLASFAVVQPNPGHVFMGVMPLVAVLILIAVHDPVAKPQRVAAALLGGVFLLGWFGGRSHDIWYHPRVFAEARAVYAGQARAQTEFVTDVGRALDYVKAQSNLGCVALSPELTLVHALANVPGPTASTLRWNAEQQRELARRIRAARCPLFVYQMGSFDRPDQPNWFLGEDLFVIQELYEPARRLGPATYALRLRAAPVPPRHQPLRSARLGDSVEVSVPGELVIPFEPPLSGAEFLRIGSTLEVSRLAAALGAAPKVSYRFEHAGEPVSDAVPWFDLIVGRRSEQSLALDPVAAESRWMLGRRLRTPARADAIRLIFSPRGRLTPSRVRFTLHSLGKSSPESATREPARECTLEADLMQSVERGEAMPRGVALRPADKRVLLHPNPEPEQPAELFFALTPCEDSCFHADLAIEMPPESGDGVRYDFHVIDGRARPHIRQEVILPGPDPTSVELALSRWQGRPILLRVATHTRDDHENDYPILGRPRLARCSNRALVATELEKGSAEVRAGKVRAQSEDVVFAGGVGELVYPLHVSDDTCLVTTQRVEANGPALAELGIWILVDDLEQRIDTVRLQAADAPRPVRISLHDWFRRDVKLMLSSRRLQGDPELRVVLEKLALGRCGSG